MVCSTSIYEIRVLILLDSLQPSAEVKVSALLDRWILTAHGLPSVASLQACVSASLPTASSELTAFLPLHLSTNGSPPIKSFQTVSTLLNGCILTANGLHSIAYIQSSILTAHTLPFNSSWHPSRASIQKVSAMPNGCILTINGIPSVASLQTCVGASLHHCFFGANGLPSIAPIQVSVSVETTPKVSTMPNGCILTVNGLPSIASPQKTSLQRSGLAVTHETKCDPRHPSWTRKRSGMDWAGYRLRRGAKNDRLYQAWWERSRLCEAQVKPDSRLLRIHKLKLALTLPRRTTEAGTERQPMLRLAGVTGVQGYFNTILVEEGRRTESRGAQFLVRTGSVRILIQYLSETNTDLKLRFRPDLPRFLMPRTTKAQNQSDTIYTAEKLLMASAALEDEPDMDELGLFEAEDPLEAHLFADSTSEVLELSAFNWIAINAVAANLKEAKEAPGSVKDPMPEVLYHLRKKVQLGIIIPNYFLPNVLQFPTEGGGGPTLEKKSDTRALSDSHSSRRGCHTTESPFKEHSGPPAMRLDPGSGSGRIWAPKLVLPRRSWIPLPDEKGLHLDHHRALRMQTPRFLDARLLSTAPGLLSSVVLLIQTPKNGLSTDQAGRRGPGDFSVQRVKSDALHMRAISASQVAGPAVGWP
ncbi:hypothetical protein GGX14DRAFT_396646 [Mycena pura]|uniref:Uncharacterized protein n=1 Tax=Mycena pura TaxID=153505 RepID=A0AAD6Y9N7_9AGAR|nr:hypothetical protein GGX14DRAFT_396646 [Mycena pura]